MALFAPFRALGYITDDVPFAVQRRGNASFVTVSVGKAWQVGTPSRPGGYACDCTRLHAGRAACPRAC